MKWLVGFILIIFFFFGGFSIAFESTSTNFTVNQNIQSISGGNATSSVSTSTTFNLTGAGNQAGLGISTSTSFTNHGGYLAGVTSQFSDSFTFVIDSNTSNLGSIAPGTLGSATSILSVTTGNSTGFTISANRNDSDTTMDLDTNASINIPDKTAWNAGVNCASAGNATASTTEPLTLQFRIRLTGTDSSNYCSAWWGTNDTTASALFAGLPLASEDIVYRSSAAVTQSDSIVLYNINLPSSQVIGDYSGIVTYTAVANP